MSDLRVTETGKAVAHAAFSPRTGYFFLQYFSMFWERLSIFVNTESPPQNDEEESAIRKKRSDLAYVLFHLCYCCPEYSGDARRRFLPYPLGEQRQSERAIRLTGLLAEQPWDRNMLAVNAADISVDWISGTPLGLLEGRFNRLRGGMIRDMHNSVASLLSGMADVLTSSLVVAKQADPPPAMAWIGAPARSILLRLIRRIRQYALQVVVGLPEDMLWTSNVTSPDGQPLIRRLVALELQRQGFLSMDDLLDPGRTDRLLVVFGGGGGARNQIDRVRTAAQRVRLERTVGQKSRLLRRLPDCSATIEGFFSAREKAFEDALEVCLNCLEIQIIDRDGRVPGRARYPDFLLSLDPTTKVVVECKSSTTGKDIDLGQATEVGSKALAHGLNDHHQITLCQQYVRSDVPRLIEAAKNLSVINAEDLASAMGYLRSGTISKERFVAWLTTPGQPTVQELFRN